MSRARVARRRLPAALLTLLFAWPATSLMALERLQRRFGVEEGLPFSEVDFLAQDTRGFIWIATSGGLFRYDGAEMRPWPRTAPGAAMKWLTAGPDGEILMTDYTFTLQEVSGEGLRSVPGPNGAPFVLEWPPVFDDQGRLWILSSGRLWYRPRGGVWSELPASRFGAERPRGVERAADGSLLVITAEAIWRMDARQDAARLATVIGASKALLRPDGSLAVLTNRRGVLEIRDGVTRQLHPGLGRPIDMAQRGATLWVAYDNGLLALRSGEPPEVLGAAEDIPSGGPLLVDREGSLWLGTFRGLRQFPAPETVALAPIAARRLALSQEGVWADSWSGHSLIRREAGRLDPERIPDSVTSDLCVGSDGVLWTAYKGRILERRDARFLEHPSPGLDWMRRCASGRDGRVWMTTSRGLMLARRDNGGARGLDVSAPESMDRGSPFGAVLEDSNGQLWLSQDDQICSTGALAAASGGAPSWRCARLAGAGEITDIAQLVSGSIWASTVLAGVYRLEADRGIWVPLPGSGKLPTDVVRRLRPSPSGGGWIVSFGTVLRVIERPGSVDGWEVVERPSTWHGLMVRDAEDILEETSGDLWIATLAGVVRIPAGVRRSLPAVPAVELVDVLQDSARIPLQVQDGLELPWRRNRIELRFAALSYRDPGLLRYQVRLHNDAAWADATGPASFRFVDLPPGTYHAEVRASLDGTRWSETPAGLTFTVLPPFWRTWWFLSLSVVAAAVLAHGVYRYRLAQLLKLERMRTRIAADLHDDIGSSLSRIAIQSELIRRPTVIRPEDSERLLSDIGESARSLVDSMSDIVWSIDPKRDDLASLVSRVRQFALDMLEPLGVALTLSVPEGADRVRLAPERRRHLYLFLKEAINNIAKHAGCRSAVITMKVEGARLSVEVRDDGRGFQGPAGPPAAPPRSRGGHGLESMRARARKIGGELSVVSAPGSGTTLLLTCSIEHAGA